MKRAEAIAGVRKLLRQRDDWHAWMLSYSLTHSRLELALHSGSYPRYTGVECLDCVRIEGDVQGGGYQLTLEERSNGDDELLVLSSSDGRFRVTCGSVRVTVERA